MDKNKLVKVLGFTAFSVLIIASIINLIDGEYFEALGCFCLALSLFVFPHDIIIETNPLVKQNFNLEIN